MAIKIQNLVLHIGNSKTGTSAIQRWLAENAAYLSRAGVLYPQAGRQGDAHHPVAALMRKQVNPSWVPSLSIETLVQQLERELSGGDYETVILSSEVFWQAHDFSIISALFGRPCIKVIALVRRQDQWAESMYRHQLKNGRDVGSSRAWADRRRHTFDYSYVLGRWAFQLDNISMRVMDFDKACADGLIESFAQLVGLPEHIGNTLPAAKVNVSLVDEAMGLFHTYKSCYPKNKHSADWAYARKILEDYSVKFASEMSVKKAFSLQELTQIAAYSENGNAWLRQVTKGQIKLRLPLEVARKEHARADNRESGTQLNRFLQRYMASDASPKEKEICANLIALLAQIAI